MAHKMESERILALIPRELVSERYLTLHCRLPPPRDIARPPNVEDVPSDTLRAMEGAMSKFPAFSGAAYQVILAAARRIWCGDRWVLQRWFPTADTAAAAWFGKLADDLSSQQASLRNTMEKVLDAALKSDVMDPWRTYRRGVTWSLEFMVAVGVATDYQLALLHSKFRAAVSYADVLQLRAALVENFSFLCCAVHEAAFASTWPDGVAKLLPRNQHLATRWILLHRTPIGRRIMWIMGWHPSPAEEEELWRLAPTASEYVDLVDRIC